MTNAMQSLNRRTRCVAAFAIGLGLAAGTIAGTGVASADGGTLSNTDPGTATGPLNDVSGVAGKLATDPTKLAKGPVIGRVEVQLDTGPAIGAGAQPLPTGSGQANVTGPFPLHPVKVNTTLEGVRGGDGG